MIQTEFSMTPRALPFVPVPEESMSALNSSMLVQAGPHLEKHTELVNYVVFNEDCSSLLSKHLSYEIWNKYAGQKDSSGISFERNIFEGCCNPTHPLGVRPSGRDSYYAFRDLYDAIINEY
jgi:hypothetical protein